jgi:5-carboxymethyl-2-hydroxymuconate isomerase
MPHLVIEITNNITVDQPKLLANANAALLATGEFKEPDIKSRCVALQSYRQGTEQRSDGFIHATLSILSGRSDATRKAVAEAVRDAIVESLPAGDRGYGVTVSVDVREMFRDTFAKAVLAG